MEKEINKLKEKIIHKKRTFLLRHFWENHKRIGMTIYSYSVGIYKKYPQWIG
jgi:hypothetical protein